MTGRRAGVVAGALAALTWALCAAAAPAATVTQDQYGNTGFAAAAGEANRVLISNTAAPGQIVFRDVGAPLSAGSGCTQGADANTVSCPAALHDPCESPDNRFSDDTRLRCDQVTVRLGDGNDVFLNAMFASVHRVATYGEAGDDVIERLPSPAGTAPDTEPMAEWGGDGDDLLIGREEADDRLIGGLGDDTVVPRSAQKPAPDNRPWRTAEDHVIGSDAIVPIDRVEPGTSAPANSVLRDGVGGVRGGSAFAPSKFRAPAAQAAGQAKGRERDTLRFSEVRTAHPELLGGDGVVVYPAVKEAIVSAIAQPTRTSSGGDFEIVYGGSGDDQLYGDAANNQLYGGSGDDRLRDGVTQADGKRRAGKDRLDGGKGNDTIDSTDPIYNKGKVSYGKDTIVCGKGKDSAKYDRADKLVGSKNGGCEKAKRI